MRDTRQRVQPAKPPRGVLSAGGLSVSAVLVAPSSPHLLLANASRSIIWFRRSQRLSGKKIENDRVVA